MTNIDEGKYEPAPSLPFEKDVLKNHLILIAEDNETHYTSLQYMLGKAGMETLHAMNGAQLWRAS